MIMRMLNENNVFKDPTTMEDNYNNSTNQNLEFPEDHEDVKQ